MSNALALYFDNIKRTFLTIGDGLAVTTSYLFRKPITIQYPDRIAKPLAQTLPKRSRGILEMDSDLCTGCLICEKQCPIDCIHIDVVKNQETKQRMLEKFDIDIGKCMFCGICEEACPTQALRHSAEFEGGMQDINRFMLKFIDLPRPVAKAKREEGFVEKPKGSIVRPMLTQAWEKGSGSQSHYNPTPVEPKIHTTEEKPKAEDEGKA